MKNRKANIKRKTAETDIHLALTIDGTGKYNIDTGVGFFDHMLELFTRHGLFNLTIKAKGDTKVDYHHTIEDIGICLGKAFQEALGDCRGIRRYASMGVVMDESLSYAAIDISGRPHLEYNVKRVKTKIGEFDIELAEEFFKALVMNARWTLHLELIRGDNLHHIIESNFKSVARVIRQAVELDSKFKGIPSTKGIL